MKTWAPLAVAVGLGLTAAVAARKWMAQAHAPRHEAAVRQIVVASHDVAPGTALTQSDLALTAIPMDASAAGTFSRISDLLGRVTVTGLDKDKAVLGALLASNGSAGGLQSLIPEGMRAITLEVNEFSGVGGLLAPGCRVDLIATLRRDQKNDTTTRIIAQNLVVKAVGQSLRHQETPDNKKDAKEPTGLPRSVTLLATPKEAEMIQLACESGRPWLVLRGGKDDAPVKTPGVTLAELRGKPADKDKPQGAEKNIPVVQVQMPTTRPMARQEEAEAKVRRTVQLIRGASESTVIFEMPAKMTVSSVAE
jgi:pilus assembly protein CpaB